MKNQPDVLEHKCNPSYLGGKSPKLSEIQVVKNLLRKCEALVKSSELKEKVCLHFIHVNLWMKFISTI
jgi:hypothetical protein